MTKSQISIMLFLMSQEGMSSRQFPLEKKFCENKDLDSIKELERYGWIHINDYWVTVSRDKLTELFAGILEL